MTGEIDMKKLFSKRLIAIMQDNNINQVELSKILTVSESTVGKWVLCKAMPRMGVIQKLSDYFGVGKSYFLEDDMATIQKIKTTPAQDQSIRIPVLGYVVAGVPISAVQDILGYEEISKDLSLTGEFFALRIKGSSMEPQFFEGDIVIVRQQSDVDDNDIAIVLVNGDEATVKQIKKSDAGITLIGFNVTVYPPRFYSNKDIEELPVSIIGKVVQIRRDY